MLFAFKIVFMAFWVAKKSVLYSEIWQSLLLWFESFAIMFRMLFWTVDDYQFSCQPFC